MIEIISQSVYIIWLNKNIIKNVVSAFNFKLCVFLISFSYISLAFD